MLYNDVSTASRKNQLLFIFSFRTKQLLFAFYILPNIFLTTVEVPLCGTQERRHHALFYEAFASFFLCSSQITSHLNTTGLR